MKSIKNQALQDMRSSGVPTIYILQEKEILEFISEDSSIKVDFRRFNGGHYDKSNLLSYNTKEVELFL